MDEVQIDKELNKSVDCFVLYSSLYFVCVLRGLLGGHSMAVMLRDGGQHMQWYQDELLHMAKDLGLRLLPAFNTSSGLPYPRVRRTYCAFLCLNGGSSRLFCSIRFSFKIYRVKKE